MQLPVCLKILITSIVSAFRIDLVDDLVVFARFQHTGSGHIAPFGTDDPRVDITIHALFANREGILVACHDVMKGLTLHDSGMNYVTQRFLFFLGQVDSLPGFHQQLLVLRMRGSVDVILFGKHTRRRIRTTVAHIRGGLQSSAYFFLESAAHGVANPAGAAFLGATSTLAQMMDIAVPTLHTAIGYPSIHRLVARHPMILNFTRNRRARFSQAFGQLPDRYSMPQPIFNLQAIRVRQM
jgi:hypothetical protein